MYFALAAPTEALIIILFYFATCGGQRALPHRFFFLTVLRFPAEPAPWATPPPPSAPPPPSPPAGSPFNPKAPRCWAARTPISASGTANEPPSPSARHTGTATATATAHAAASRASRPGWKRTAGIPRPPPPPPPPARLNPRPGFPQLLPRPRPRGTGSHRKASGGGPGPGKPPEGCQRIAWGRGGGGGEGGEGKH